MFSSFEDIFNSFEDIFKSFKELPGCLFTRTFLPKSSYTLLHMLECLKLHASSFNKFNMWDFYGNIKLSL